MLEIATVITNGHVDASTIVHMTTRGWTYMCTIPAKVVHPHALENDKLTMFGRYNENEIIEEETMPCE